MTETSRALVSEEKNGNWSGTKWLPPEVIVCDSSTAGPGSRLLPRTHATCFAAKMLRDQRLKVGALSGHELIMILLQYG